jgi:uncharacterized damage-inducible protein DinB
MRRDCFLYIAILMVPAVLGAQQRTVAPEQTVADPITRTFRGFGFYGSRLLDAFAAIPASKYDFKPTPVQQSVGYIAQHLEDANYGLCTIIGGAPPALTARDSVADTVKAKWPKDTLIARLRKSRVFCDHVMAHVTDAGLADTLTVGPPGSQRTAPRVRWVILLVTDLAEHYSQLASYMRLLGLVPPSALPRTGQQL